MSASATQGGHNKWVSMSLSVSVDLTVAVCVTPNRPGDDGSPA